MQKKFLLYQEVQMLTTTVATVYWLLLYTVTLQSIETVYFLSWCSWQTNKNNIIFQFSIHQFSFVMEAKCKNNNRHIIFTKI
jgi:hypothetical protein